MSNRDANGLVTLTIDGKEVTVPKGTLIIRAAEELGIEIPRFCDHPLLDPVAACRQCYVKVEGQRKLMTSCSTPVVDGMVVFSQFTDDEVKNAQASVLEFLLINHPLDCPVCDRGGECPLQDQALAFGPGESRYVEAKRTYRKPLPLSPLVALDRERCVLCARCTRFCDQISGDRFIELFDRGAAEQVSIAPGEDFRSPFSGNTIQICPVGALTARTYRFAARPRRAGDRLERLAERHRRQPRLAEQRRGQAVDRVRELEREAALVAGPQVVHVRVVPRQVPRDLAPAEVHPDVAPGRAVVAHAVRRTQVEGPRDEPVRHAGQRAHRADLDRVPGERRAEVLARRDGHLLRGAALE